MRFPGLDAIFQSIPYGGTSLVSEFLSCLRLHEAATCKVAFKSVDGTFYFLEEFLPFLHFFIVTVTLSEVTRRVVSHTIRNRFYKNGTFFFDNKFSSLFTSIVNSENIVTVNSN